MGPSSSTALYLRTRDTARTSGKAPRSVGSRTTGAPLQAPEELHFPAAPSAGARCLLGNVVSTGPVGCYSGGPRTTFPRGPRGTGPGLRTFHFRAPDVAKELQKYIVTSPSPPGASLSWGGGWLLGKGGKGRGGHKAPEVVLGADGSSWSWGPRVVVLCSCQVLFDAVRVASGGGESGRDAVEASEKPGVACAAGQRAAGEGGRWNTSRFPRTPASPRGRAARGLLGHGVRWGWACPGSDSGPSWALAMPRGSVHVHPR